MLTAASGLYLLLPAAFTPAADTARVAEALAGAAGVSIDAVLLWLATPDEAAWRAAVGALLPVLHGMGIPLILGADAARAIRLGADGAHLETGIDGIAAACAAHQPRHMIGAGGIVSRHDAMLAGEAGADYVLFGSADPGRSQPLGFARRLELAEWWSALFKVPGVAVADTVDEARALAGVGIDFIAVRDLVWRAGHGPGAALEGLVRALERAPQDGPPP